MNFHSVSAWQKSLEIVRKAKRLIESSRLVQAGLVLALAGFVLFFSSGDLPPFLGGGGLESQKGIIISDKRSKHICEVSPFSQRLKRGQEGRISVNLKPSANGNPYELLLGNLPEGITGKIDRPNDSAPRKVNASFSASLNAQKGSFNAVIIYFETNEEGQRLPNFCQFNLIIDL